MVLLYEPLIYFERNKNRERTIYA